MKAETLSKIIKSIDSFKSYTISLNGKDKQFKGNDFKSHIITVSNKISDEDAEKLLKSITDVEVKKEVKAEKVITNKEEK